VLSRQVEIQTQNSAESSGLDIEIWESAVFWWELHFDVNKLSWQKYSMTVQEDKRSLKEREQKDQPEKQKENQVSVRLGKLRVIISRKKKQSSVSKPAQLPEVILPWGGRTEM
jgi:hypothetical protein